MSTDPGSRAARRRSRRRVLTEAGSVMLAIVLLIWSLLPIYNMLLIALDPEEGEIEFTGNIWPPEPSFDSFRDVVTQEARYLEDFWQQFGNSVYIGVLTMILTVLIGSLASFARFAENVGDPISRLATRNLKKSSPFTRSRIR